MALYITVRENSFFKKGSFVEDVEDGMVQAVHMVPDKGTYQPYTNYGLVVPRKEVRKALLRIQSRRIDEEGLRG